MLSYFLNIMRQKSGGSSFVCVQLLQTLNILFENIRNETSLCESIISMINLARNMGDNYEVQVQSESGL